jgi:hypothetical protein
MNLNHLLDTSKIDPEDVLVLRHRPPERDERELNKVLPWLAAERPELFNAYQQVQSGKLEKAMLRMIGAGYVAAFLGHEPGRAVFVGLYSIAGIKTLTAKQYTTDPLYLELRTHGMKAFATGSRPTIEWFDLRLCEFYREWKGKLVVGWPPPEQQWWRRANKNKFPVQAVLENSVLDAKMPAWEDIELTYDDLKVLPTAWRATLAQWRAIYYIFDTADGKGYVGSAYGENNLWQRWNGYAATGHGGNRLLKPRDPSGFRFTILQRVSPDMEGEDVIRLENTWKQRLHTREPFGLNDN